VGEPNKTPMKNSSIKHAFKAFLAIALFSLGFGKAAAHVDPSHSLKSHTSNPSSLPPPPTYTH